MISSEQPIELTVENLCVRVGDRFLVENASLKLRSGELVVLLGPNGAGKTSLLRGILGLARKDSGAVQLQGRTLAEFNPQQRARQLSYLPQRRPLAWPSPVRDVVSLGRYAWGCAPGRLGAEDIMAVNSALAACDLHALADRPCDTLSGGELSRTHMARAMAAEAPLLLADEPTEALDPLHQHQVLSLIRAYADAGNGALVVLHEAALAARFADRLAWIREGHVVGDGPPAETLTPERMAEVYRVQATVRRIEDDWVVAVFGPA